MKKYNIAYHLLLLFIAAFILIGSIASAGISVSAETKTSSKTRQAKIAKYLKKSDTAELCSQIILVCGHELSLWNKKSDGTWKCKCTYYCGYGRNGFSADRTEGDMTTPIGSFPILFAFGNAKNPGTSMSWRDITKYSYWSDEKKTYNTWVESKKIISGEHLADYYQYDYAMAIGFNTDPTIYKKGSAIFLHCKSSDRWDTSGCVSIKKNAMKKLLKNCKDGTYIMIVPKVSDIKKY